MARPKRGSRVAVIVGIDGSNLRAGGGVTHLDQMLRAARPAEHGIENIRIWGSRSLLERLPDRGWLDKRTERRLEGSLPLRLLWQRADLPRLAADCDLLFAPGGSVPHRFSPVVTMSRNMLPFEPHERRRYGASWIGLRLWVLRGAQARSFRRADGLIFLTDYARRLVSRTVPRSRGVRVIPHGVVERYRRPPRTQRSVSECSATDPLRLLYVSIIDLYKHHVAVVRAVARLRAEGLPVAIDLVGPAYPPALRSLRRALRDLDPDGAFLHHRGPAMPAELAAWYGNAEIFVFASSCENMPNIVLEAMAAGLPIACADRGPMPEVLAGSGELFDPENDVSIAEAVRRLVADPELRRRRAEASYRRALDFSWARCADETMAFLREVYEERSGIHSAAGQRSGRFSNQPRSGS